MATRYWKIDIKLYVEVEIKKYFIIFRFAAEANCQTLPPFNIQTQASARLKSFTAADIDRGAV